MATIDTGDLQVLTLDGAGNFSLGGVISDEGSLVKDGSGTAFLNAANTYDGQTTINTGAVDVENTGTTTINPNGGTLDLAGSGTLNNSGSRIK